MHIFNTYTFYMRHLYANAFIMNDITARKGYSVSYDEMFEIYFYMNFHYMCAAMVYYMLINVYFGLT